ncbi:hypothetical protein SCUP515_02837 [Seiridium cupressi]
MTSGPPVKIGPWTNYDVRPRIGDLANVITVPETRGTMLKILLGVVFGLSWPCASSILSRSWAWSLYLYHRWVSEKKGAATSEYVPLLTGNDTISSSTEMHGDSNEADITQAGPNDFGLGTRVTASEADQALQDRQINSIGGDHEFVASRRWLKIVLTVLLAIAAILYATAGGAAGEIPAGTEGLSDTENCGFWDLKKNADQRIKDNDDLIQARKEARAAQYGRNCYGEQSIGNADQCEFFQSRQIEYTVERIDCPFDCPNPDNCVCTNGIYGSGVRLSTGAFPASIIGSNDGKLPLIKRTSIFVPLDIDYGFVVDNSGAEFQFDYHLGSVNASGEFRNHTFTMFGTPFNWDIPAYSVSAYESTPFGKEYDAWWPISELARPDHTYMTAIFISPCRIIYSGRCEDYVFQATDELRGEGWPPHRHYNRDPRARVLIAIDQMEVCMPDTDHCFHPEKEYPENGVLYEMVRTALRRSSSFRSIRYRLGSALVAAESISDFESRQLDKEQWIIESKALFNTSLSRLQFNMLDIATGDRPVGDVAAGFEDAYHDTTPSWARGRMCGKYKFNLPNAYTNINVAESVLILMVPILLWLCSLQTPWGFEDKQRPWFRGNWMFFDTCIWAIVFAVGWCIHKIR